MEVTGFFEESPGVRSMTRFAIFVLLLLTAAVVATVCAYVLKGKPDAAIVAALTGVVTALVLNGAVAIIKRNGGTETETK